MFVKYNVIVWAKYLKTSNIHIMINKIIIKKLKFYDFQRKCYLKFKKKLLHILINYNWIKLIIYRYLPK